MHFHLFLFILCICFHFRLRPHLFEFICFLGGRQVNISDFVVFVSTFDIVHHTLSVAFISFIIGEVSRYFLLSTDRCLAFIFFVPLLPFLLLTYHPSYTDHVYTYRSSPLLPDISYPLEPLFLFPSLHFLHLTRLLCHDSFYLDTLSDIISVYDNSSDLRIFAPHRLSVCLLRLFFQIPQSLAAIFRLASSPPLSRSWTARSSDDSRSYLLVFIELSYMPHIRLVVSLSDAWESSKSLVVPGDTRWRDVLELSTQWRWRVACTQRSRAERSLFCEYRQGDERSEVHFRTFVFLCGCL